MEQEDKKILNYLQQVESKLFKFVMKLFATSFSLFIISILINFDVLQFVFGIISGFLSISIIWVLPNFAEDEFKECQNNPVRRQLYLNKIKDNEEF